MNEHRYKLEPYKGSGTRFRCPGCNKEKEFTRYIDTETNEYLDPSVGICNHQISCGYHHTPKQYFQDNNITNNTLRPASFFKPKAVEHSPIPMSTIPEELFKGSLKRYEGNFFVMFLNNLFGPGITDQLIRKYHIGTSRYWKGAVILWQIDNHGKVRDGKVMLYDPLTGHRVKKPFNYISWTHSILKIKDYNLQQCFFGAHLLPLYPDLPIAIVESEKTAIIASIYFPQFIWIATGGKNGCKWTTREVCEVLKGRKVSLWPDLNAFHDWQKKANLLIEYGLKVDISGLLESKANEQERAAGLDIADFLIRFPFEQFKQEPNAQPP